MNNLILSFSNINIHLEFHQEPLEMRLKKDLMDQIILNYGSLITKNNKDSNINLKVVFRDSNNFRLIKFKKQNIYSEFYTKIDPFTYVTYYHISILQFQQLLHIILHDNTGKGSTFILHASGNLLFGKSSLFLGRSGSGKSTIMKMLSTKYPPIADDSIIIDRSGDSYFTYQTPFVEKAINIVKKNNRIPLGGIYFLIKSKRYSIHQIKDKNLIFNKLLQNCIIESSTNIPAYIKKTYKLAHEFNHFYFIEFGLNKKKLYELFNEDIV